MCIPTRHLFTAHEHPCICPLKRTNAKHARVCRLEKVPRRQSRCPISWGGGEQGSGCSLTWFLASAEAEAPVGGRHRMDEASIPCHSWAAGHLLRVSLPGARSVTSPLSWGLRLCPLSQAGSLTHPHAPPWWGGTNKGALFVRKGENPQTARPLVLPG